MSENLELKDIVSMASPVIKALVDTFVTPKLIAFREKHSIRSISHFFNENDFTEYYHRVYKKNIVVNTLVFNNSQRLLSDIYIPLTLVSSHNDKIRTKVTKFPKGISDEYGNILVTDTAGMGKSTLMKKIFIDCIYDNYGIPLFIELRRLNRDKKIVDEIKEQLNSINKNFDSKLLLELLADGGFVIILDGFDEISLSDRDIVTQDIQEFISKASYNKFFITSRPEKSLASFGNFQEFKILPLSKKEAFELLRKYDKQGSVSGLLIKKLEEKEMSNIDEFLTNPLLISLLYTAFEYKQTIPFKKHLFYRQVYDANFESHDLTKGDSYTHKKYSKLETDDFHRVLRHVGFSCFKLQKIEFTKDELLKLITDSNSFCVGLNFKESDFLQDILETVPLFTQDGNYYRWSHKSLQEYFAAQFIYLDSKSLQNEILNRMYEHSSIEKFINVMDLYYDMDYKTFRGVIIYPLLKNFIDYTGHILNTFKGRNRESLIKRCELTFLTDYYLFRTPDSDNAFDPIETDKFEEMLRNGSSEYIINGKKNNGIVLRSTIENLYCINYQDAKYQLILLLYNKRNEVVKTLDDDARTFLEDIHKINLKIDYTFDTEYELIPIDNEPNNKLNSVENFDKMNIMISLTIMDHQIMDYDRSLLMLKDIEQNLESEKNDRNLMAGF